MKRTSDLWIDLTIHRSENWKFVAESLNDHARELEAENTELKSSVTALEESIKILCQERQEMATQLAAYFNLRLPKMEPALGSPYGNNKQCHHCHGMVDIGLSFCPHCDTSF